MYPILDSLVLLGKGEKPRLAELLPIFSAWRSRSLRKDDDSVTSNKPIQRPADEEFEESNDHAAAAEGSETTYREGAVTQVLENDYERNPKARAACKTHYGTTCYVCGLRLSNVYGDIAENVIHVHHIRPLSDTNGEYEVDPIKDLRPVCPNCHAVIHLRLPAYTIEEVKRAINNQQCEH